MPHVELSPSISDAMKEQGFEESDYVIDRTRTK
jgi:hypothetical protein